MPWSPRTLSCRAGLRPDAHAGRGRTARRRRRGRKALREDASADGACRQVDPQEDRAPGKLGRPSGRGSKGFPFGNLTGRRTASRDGGPTHFGYKVPAFTNWSASIWMSTKRISRIFSDIPMWSTRPTAIRTCTRWDDFPRDRGRPRPAAPWIPSILVSPAASYEGSTRNMPTPARDRRVAICSTAARCSVRCPRREGDYTQIAFLRSDIDDSTGSIPNVSRPGRSICPLPMPLRFDLAVDLMDYFSGRTFEGERRHEPRSRTARGVAAVGGSHRLRPQFLRRLLARLSLAR